MTKIVVFCDGTWNAPDAAEPTSIVKLYNAVESDPAKGQIAAYFAGIGTVETYDTRLQALLRKYGGGIFGWGLDAKVKQAYQFLSMVYQRGDEIYLFGFSRGAYTARSVAGMIRKCGLAADVSPEGINRAFELYRKRGASNKPDTPHILEERREVSPRFATSQVDLDWRNDGSEIVNIAYLGVFDTVGARGIPVALFGPVATLWNNPYKFHDAQLSRLVRSARHAIATDERRVFYVPARWDNVSDLNGKDDGPLRPYQQSWFVGNHGMVGGSKSPPALSVLPQAWVLAGAGGLALKPGKGPDLMQADPLAKSIHLPEAGGLLKRWRKGPERGDTVHVSVMQRVQGRADYRPRSMGERLKAWMRG